jgi:hypothetical protein
MGAGKRRCSPGAVVTAGCAVAVPTGAVAAGNVDAPEVAAGVGGSGLIATVGCKLGLGSAAVVAVTVGSTGEDVQPANAGSRRRVAVKMRLRMVRFMLCSPVKPDKDYNSALYRMARMFY